jgi:hypothetical protein
MLVCVSAIPSSSLAFAAHGHQLRTLFGHALCTVSANVGRIVVPSNRLYKTVFAMPGWSFIEASSERQCRLQDKSWDGLSHHLTSHVTHDRCLGFSSVVLGTSKLRESLPPRVAPARMHSKCTPRQLAMTCRDGDCLRNHPPI